MTMLGPRLCCVRAAGEPPALRPRPLAQDQNRCVAEVGAAGRLLLAATQESSSRGEVGGDGGDGHATFREHQQAEALAEEVAARPCYCSDDLIVIMI